MSGAELERLAHALRGEIRRRRAQGRRRVVRVDPPLDPAPQAPPPAPTAGPLFAPGPGASGAEEGPEARVRRGAAACDDLAQLREAVAGCTECGLCETRTQTVFSDGLGTRRLMFVGEAPGYHEDRQGVPFVGRAGQLLTDIIEKGMGLKREEVTIANVLKCRPPDNRDPSVAEKRVCTGWLDRQIELLDPEVIVALGGHAAGHLLSSEASIGRLRGRVHERAGRKVIATYHPAYLLRTPSMKKECWKDIQQVMRLLGLSPPARA